MKKERRSHSREFIQEAVALVLEQGYSSVEAGRNLGGQVRYWSLEATGGE